MKATSAAWRWPLLVANLAATLFAVSMVWVPEVRVNWAGTPRVPDEQIILARSQPSDAVLAEIGSQYLGISAIAWRDGEDATRKWIETGNAVVNGTMPLGGYLAEPMPFPFRAENLEIGLPAQQLLVASMVSTHLLLKAYRASGERRFLDAALQEAIAFADVDERHLLPRGFLWNDHALTTRISVLADLWSVVRADPNVTEDQARKLLKLVDRSAARLAKPELYTFRTNHGIMQSLALLQFALAFPALERAADSRSVGCARLAEQFVYYMNGDGITLEHSAGYHELGRQLLSLAVRLVEMNECPVPAEWHVKLERATYFSRLLTRPDRTLPAFGNTDHAPLADHEAVDPTIGPHRDWAIHPSAGFAVSWRGLSHWPDSARMAQTVVTWSSYPSRAHKLADDMSLVVWAAGRPWITNTGYWPYGVDGHDKATLWRGSNAPHLPGETRPAHGTTSLRRIGQGPDARVLELERVAANGAVLRRQIVELSGTTWIVIDSTDGPGSAIDKLWTTMPDTKIERRGDYEYVLRGFDVGVTARLSFLGDLERPPHLRVGETEPFAGWIMKSAERVPAPAFDVRQRVPGVSATVLVVGTAGAESGKAELVTGRSAEHWRIAVRGVSEGHYVERSGNRLLVSAVDGTRHEVHLLDVGDDALEGRRAAVAAYEAAATRYPVHRDLIQYRYKLSYLMVGLLLLQELTILAARRRSTGAALALRGMAAAAWVALGFWAHFAYLR